MFTLKILDLGCGTGVNMTNLQRRGQVYGLDLSKENIEIAKIKFPQGVFLSHDATQPLPYDDGFFDEVHCYDVLEHVDDLPATTKEIARVLKQGGKLVIEVPNAKSEDILKKIRPQYWGEIHHVRSFTPQTMATLWNSLNMTLVQTKKLKGVEHIFLSFIFSRGVGITDQNGSGKKQWTVQLARITYLFTEDVWKRHDHWSVLATPTALIGKLFSLLFPKTYHYEFRKN
jgi:SAM-dependent methyltransferase